MIHWIHTMVWGPGMLVLFLAVGILYTLRLRGFVFWGFPRWWKNTAGSLWKTPEKTGTNEENIQGGDAAGGMSPFQSACTALAATIGTGNIAGVATALLSGGPGAIFWMWVSAFLGMATAYGETVLGIRYRKRDRSGGWVAGPMLYMERGLGCRWAGLLYAGLCAAASFGMGSMVQANAISETLEFSFSMPPVLIGGLLVLLSGRIMAGGAGAIAGAAEKMVPVSAGIYMAASAAVLFLFRENIPSAFGMIFQDAFSFRSAAGGAVGLLASKSVQYGIARGVFSNEAGLGSLAVLNPDGGGDPLCHGRRASGLFRKRGRADRDLLFQGPGEPGRIYGVHVRGPVCLCHHHRLVLYGAAGGLVPGGGGRKRSGPDLYGRISGRRIPWKPWPHGAGLGGFGRAQRMYGSAEPGGAGAVIREGGPSRASREGALTAVWRYGRDPAGEEGSGGPGQKKDMKKAPSQVLFSTK